MFNPLYLRVIYVQISYSNLNFLVMKYLFF